MDTKEKAKVIFVNSFKGGAGKTTLSFAHCINNLFNKSLEHYENTIYIDLDILGTGTCYLFRDGLLQEDKSFEITERAVEVELELNGEKGSMHVAYLKPSSKIRVLYGENYFVNHQTIAAEMLKCKVLEYIKNQIRDVESTLVVIDCAPGFSEMEQAILRECYRMASEGKIIVEEDYVTTLDTAHVQKCIHCLNDSVVGYQKYFSERDIRIIINDAQNYLGYVQDEKHSKPEERQLQIVNRIQHNIKHDVGNTKLSVIWWKYSQDIAVESVYTEETTIENHPDWYIFTNENYKVLYSGETKEREENNKKGVN